MYVGGQWGEVCGDDFNNTEADVACHQLGFVNSVYNQSFQERYIQFIYHEGSAVTFERVPGSWKTSMKIMA